MHYGIVPVENSLEGAVNQSLDMFMDSDVIIMGEVYVEIAENLLNKTGRKEDIKKIYSHPSPLGQCSKWLAKNFPDTELIPCESTALAAEMAQNDETVAAIGSELAEAVYNLKVIERHIEDGAGNFTRFVVIGKNHQEATGINMTTLESRPSKQKPWEYLFYTDIDGHKDSPEIKKVLDEFIEKTPIAKVLGSYPKGEF